MSARLEISDVRLRFPSLPTNNLVCWASCVVAGVLKLANIAVTRGAGGGLALGFPARFSKAGLGFPARFSKAGGKHFYFEPVDREARRALEEAILGKLSGLQSDAGEETRGRSGAPARDGGRQER